MLLKKVSLALAGAGMLGASLVGCGGGSDAPSASTSEKAATLAAVPTTVAQATRVVDGPLRNALVCLDANDNGACDSGEAQGRSDAAGRLTLQLPSAGAGKFPLLAVVGTDAVDAATGAVRTRFVLKAPADQAALITPLTTLVQAYAELSGGTTAAAVTAVRALAGLGISPLQDYSGATDVASVRAATLARLVVLAQQQAVAALKNNVVGKPDLSGATATQADLDKAVRYTVLDALPALAAVAAAAADTSVTPAANREAVLQAAAAEALSKDLKLDASKALALIGMSKLPLEAATASRQAGGNLRGFIFTDANNWFYRANLSTAADNTPSIDGTVRYYSLFRRTAGGQLTEWGYHADAARANDMHWNGRAWASCPLGQRSSQKPLSATRWTYNYCDGMETGSMARSLVDISGQTLSSVVTKLRAFPGGVDGVPYALWGPANLALLGTDRFPQGSKLQYYSSITTATALAYDAQGSAIVTAYTPAVAAGGDARTTSTVACGAVTPTNAAAYKTTPATLEALVSVSRGTPCTYGTSTNSDGTSTVPNQWWSNSTVSLGKVSAAMTQPVGTGNYYTTSALLRVAFGTGNATTYYKCLERNSDGSTRNCTAIGKGTYAIAVVGDARVMSFTGLPQLSQRQGWSRVLVQRGGVIHLGYQNRAGSLAAQARLNLVAGNAVLGKLGLSPLTPQ
jgi:hypothetical protein